MPTSTTAKIKTQTSTPNPTHTPQSTSTSTLQLNNRLIPITANHYSHVLHAKTSNPTISEPRSSSFSPYPSKTSSHSSHSDPSPSHISPPPSRQVPSWTIPPQTPLIRTILHLLRQHFPQSLPLYRRIERGPVSVEGAGRVWTNLDFASSHVIGSRAWDWAGSFYGGGEEGKDEKERGSKGVDGMHGINKMHGLDGVYGPDRVDEMSGMHRIDDTVTSSHATNTDCGKDSNEDKSIPSVFANTTNGQTTSHPKPEPTLNHTTAPPKQWYIAFTDPSQRPETTTWLFGSWETTSPRILQTPHEVYTAYQMSSSATTTSSSSTTCSIQQERKRDQAELTERTTLLYDLITSMRAEPLPPSIHSINNNSNHNDNDHALKAPHEEEKEPQPILFGSLHASTVAALKDANVLDFSDPDFAEPFIPNHHFTFASTALLPRPAEGDEGAGLPVGLLWGKLRHEDLGLVIRRSHIPRKPRTLGMLRNLAIFPEGGEAEEAGLGSPAPVAWAFVGLDGSLTTLHVEGDWRGLGLAKKLTAKLFREELDLPVVDGEGKGTEREGTMAHSVVIRWNEASMRVMRSLGGESQWWCYWVQVMI